MLKVLFLVQDEQKANLDRLYDGIASACDCDLRRLSAEEQKDLQSYFKNVDVRSYDRIMLILRSKKIMEQTHFLKTLPNLIFLEHDAWQNYTACKYKGRFSKLYRQLPDCTVISSGYGVSQKLHAEGVDARFVPKGYDQALLSNLGQERDIECAFVGSVQNSIYKERSAFLKQLVATDQVQLLQTAPGPEYLKTLNRVRFFISADIGFGEYMLKNFEAMACGCIVLAFDQGNAENAALGFEDMENILLYRNQQELLEKLDQLRQDDALAERIRQGGQALAESRYRFDQLGEAIVHELRLSKQLPRILPKIHVLIPYFGHWPEWSPFFFQSLSHNPNIRWTFFTDCGMPPDCPVNATIIDTSFSDYCRLVSERLGIDFTPTSPYKLCDLKPALGFIHQDIIRDDDYWAFSDIDLVYGDLERYFFPLLPGKAVISTHERRISGHFCLLRNIDRINRLFMQAPQWQQLLSSSKHEVFDERAFSKLFISRKNFPRRLFRLYNWCANPLFRQSRFQEAFTTPNCHVAWHDGSFNFPDYWSWKNGKLTNNLDGNRQFPYLHFMLWKKNEWREGISFKPELPTSTTWKISPSGFF